MFEPIIRTIEQEMVFEWEENICKAIKNMGVYVDKEELIKALAYDRQQYDKGYADGYSDAKKEIAEFIENAIAGKGERR